MSNTWQFKVGNPEYERYIHSAGWRQIAEQRLELDNHICPVCGGEATDVHHLTYEHFGHESMDDLVSLCRKCHNCAENFYDPAVTPWAMGEVKPKGNNFMAAMRVDALQIAPKVYDYLTSVRGSDFQSLMVLRQPDDAEKKKYWSVLNKAVASCISTNHKSKDSLLYKNLFPAIKCLISPCFVRALSRYSVMPKYSAASLDFMVSLIELILVAASIPCFFANSCFISFNSESICSNNPSILVLHYLPYSA